MKPNRCWLSQLGSKNQENEEEKSVVTKAIPADSLENDKDREYNIDKLGIKEEAQVQDMVIREIASKVSSRKCRMDGQTTRLLDAHGT